MAHWLPSEPVVNTNEFRTKWQKLEQKLNNKPLATDVDADYHAALAAATP